MNSHSQIEIGSDFVGYRIEEVIGQGGMGIVYRAYDLRLKRTVALKLVTPELALDERFRERFAREAEAAMSLEHPNVVPIYDAGDIDGSLYLAMRLVEGTDLRALLRAEGALEPARALAICRQVAAALDAAHMRGLVHRDVKPSNVLLDHQDHVYLADFGLTRRLAEGGTHASDGRSVGTPAYLAPEQIEGEPIDGRADVYSLGCLLFECLTCEVPFVRGSRLAIAWAHLEEVPPNASERNPILPSAIDAVIGRAMTKAPEERYPTCEALIAAAEKALGLRERTFLSGRRLLLLASAAILLLAAAALAAALVIRGSRDASAPPPAVRANTLVRIDPARNEVSDVVDVGFAPSVTDVNGDSLWVYSESDATISEIDPVSYQVRQTTPLSAPPDMSSLTGPVLDADEGGAWLVGSDGDGDAFLTRVVPATGTTWEYRLDVEARAVVVGEGAVWVLGRGTRGDQVLRIDPASGNVSARTRFPASVEIGGLAVGLRRVWAVASSTATLYRISPRSSKVTGHRDLGERALAGPVVRFGNVWVVVAGADTLGVDPQTLDVVDFVCCPSDRGPSAAGYGSIWLADVKAGEVVRFGGRSKQLLATIPVTGSSFWSNRCLTSIAVGAGAVWVTVGDRSTGCPT